MSTGQIIFTSQNNWRKLKCNECQVQIDQKQPKYMHFPIGNSCSFVSCLWCCYTKACQFQQFRHKCFFKCCAKPHPDFWQSLIEMLKSNCIICGMYCNSQKFQLEGNSIKFLVGKQCYKQISSRVTDVFKTSTDLQKKIFNAIKVYTRFDCSMCKVKDSGDIILATKSQIQTKQCEKCFKKSLEEEAKFNRIFQRCCQCEQTQKYQDLGILGLIGKKKLFYLVKIPEDWQKWGQSLWYCSYCLYENYLKLEKQNSRIRKPRFEFTRLKAKYQRHFMDHCMVCAKVEQQSANVYIIISQNTQSIFSYICKDCHDFKNTQPQKYRCFKALISFLKQTSQNNFQIKHAITMKQFKNNAKVMLETLLEKKKELKELKDKNDSLVWAITEQTEKKEPQHNYKRNNWQQGDYQPEDNSMKKTMLISNQIEKHQKAKGSYNQNQNQAMDTKINQPHKQSSTQLIISIQLNKFQFTPKNKASSDVFDVNAWQKKVVQEFQNFTQKQYIATQLPEKAYKLPSEEKWAPRQIIVQPQILLSKKRCQMYKQCKQEQQCLKIDLLCDICFVKFLAGDERIIEVVERIKSPNAKDVKPEFKPVINEVPKPKTKQQSGLFKGIFF